MRNRSKLSLAAITAALVFGALVAAASASRFALTSQTFKATWSSAQPLIFEGGANFGAVRCPVTIEGSFHSRTLSKVASALVGYVTNAAVAEASCTGGRARALTEGLPWHIVYESFEGTLPEITTVKNGQEGAKFQVHSNLLVVECQYTSSATSPMKGNTVLDATHRIAENLTPEAAGIPLTSGVSGTFGCPSPGILKGASATLTVQGATTRITVTLVA